MDCIYIAVFLAFSHFACSWPSPKVPIKQDSLSGEVIKSSCNDFHCLTKLFHRKRLRGGKEGAPKTTVSTSQSKDEMVDPLKTLWNYLPNRKMQYLHRLVKKSLNENVVPNLPHHSPEHINYKSTKSYLNTKIQHKTDRKHGADTHEGHLKPTAIGQSKDVFIANDAQTLDDVLITDLLNQSRKYLLTNIIKQLKLYPQQVQSAQTRTTTSRWHETRKTLEEKLNEITSNMDVYQLAYLLHHSLQHSLSALQNSQTTTGARIPHLHNLCCDIG